MTKTSTNCDCGNCFFIKKYSEQPGHDPRRRYHHPKWQLVILGLRRTSRVRVGPMIISHDDTASAARALGSDYDLN